MKTHKFTCLHAALVVVMLLVLWPACTKENKKNHHPGYLKIGTLHQVKSENILYDHALDIFTMVSHPPLLTLKSSGEIEGLLAERFTVSPDFTRWTFFIKGNFFWSDGVPVTPGDVKFSLEYIGRHVPSRRWLEKTLTEIEVIPGNAVKLTFNKPYTRLDIEFAFLPIIPRHIWQKVDRPRFYSGPGKYVGYGPLIIEYIDINAGIILFKKNNYWKHQPPGIDGIEIHMFQNPDVLSLALEKGDIDTYYKYADTYPYSNLARLAATGKFNFVKHKTTGLIFLGFNLEKEPTANRYFRLAAAMAIDYKEILKLINSGYGEIPNRGFVPPGMLYFKETPGLNQDLTAARELLNKAGFKDSNRDGILENPGGENLRLALLSTPPYDRLCQLIADYLRCIGIDVEVKMVDPAAWFSRKEQYNYDITVTRSTPWGMLMHAGWGTGYFDSRRTGEGVLHTITDPFFLNLCDAVLATRNPDKLKTYAHTLQQYYAENLPAIALIWPEEVTPYNRTFTGWSQDPLFGIFNVTNFLNLKRVNEF